VNELKQVGEDDVGFDLGDIPGAGLLGDPADLLDGQHSVHLFLMRGTSASRSDFRAWTKRPHSAA
jgi:hypothetical protein